MSAPSQTTPNKEGLLLLLTRYDVISNSPPDHYAPIFNHAQILHPVFGEELLSVVADQNDLSGVLHQQPVSAGHFDSSTTKRAPASEGPAFKVVWDQANI